MMTVSLTFSYFGLSFILIHLISTGFCHFSPVFKLLCFHFTSIFTFAPRIWIYLPLCLSNKPCFPSIFELLHFWTLKHERLFFSCGYQYCTEKPVITWALHIDSFSFWRSVIETMTWTQTDWKIKQTVERQRRTDGKSRQDTRSQRIPRISKCYLKLAPTCHKRYSGV